MEMLELCCIGYVILIPNLFQSNSDQRLVLVLMALLLLNINSNHYQYHYVDYARQDKKLS